MGNSRRHAGLCAVLSATTISCAPLSRTRSVEGPIAHVESVETVTPDYGRPRFRATLHDNTITLNAHGALVCQLRRTEHAKTTVETTVEPNTAVIVVEGAVAVVFLSLAGLMAGTGEWKEGIGGGDPDEQWEGSDADFFLMVGIPATIGGIAAFATGVDIASADYNVRTRSRSRVLPDSYAPCSNRALSGLAVSLRKKELVLRAPLGPEGKATFSLDADAISTLTDDPAVDVYIEEALVARVRLERVP